MVVTINGEAGRAAGNLVGCVHLRRHRPAPLGHRRRFPDELQQLPGKGVKPTDAQFAYKKRPLLGWALDNDKASISYTRRWMKLSWEAGWLATAAQTLHSPSKLDWNDLHQRDRLNPELIKNTATTARC